MEDLLIVKNWEEKSPRLSEVCEYLESEYDLDEINYVDIAGYKVTDTKQFE